MLKEPYCSLKILPFDPHGWFSNADPLLALIKNNKVNKAIEVGSWLGLSTRFIAENLPKKGKVYAVDTWLGSKENQGDKRLLTLYHQFLSNTVHSNLTEKIIPIRMSSIEASHALDIFADLIYIDGSHEQKDVYQDIIHWFPRLSEKGIICGDDWSIETVKEAVLQAGFELRQEIKLHNKFWWFASL